MNGSLIVERAVKNVQITEQSLKAHWTPVSLSEMVLPSNDTRVEAFIEECGQKVVLIFSLLKDIELQEQRC